MKYQLSLKLRLTKWLFLSLVALASVFGSNAKAAPPACVSAPSGLVGWWPAEGDANDVFGANNGMLENVTFTNGMVGQGFYLNGSNADVQIPDSASLKPASVTVETWVRLDAWRRQSPPTRDCNTLFSSKTHGTGVSRVMTSRRT